MYWCLRVSIRLCGTPEKVGLLCGGVFLSVFFSLNPTKKTLQARIQTTATFAHANLEKFCQWKIGETLWKSGKYWIKSGNREILRSFIFFLYPRLIVLFFFHNLHGRKSTILRLTLVYPSPWNFNWYRPQRGDNKYLDFYLIKMIIPSYCLFLLLITKRKQKLSYNLW